MFERFLSDHQVEQRYVNAGARAGNAISCIPIAGKSMNFKALVRSWVRWEKEYARRGYRTISTNSFVSYGGYARPIVGLGEKRDKNETPIFHALQYS